MAKALATRLKREAGSNQDDLIRRAFTLVFCREPRPDELQSCSEFLKKQGTESPGTVGNHPLESLCLVLLNANEFAYVD
jgi:hypothetical protein